MTYSPPAITSSGLTVPSYNDIVTNLTTQAQNIFGQDIYLGTDSQDYEMMSVFASMLNDALLALQAVYNARGPAGAIGSALDGIVAVNGISRLAPTYSTCPVVVTGTPGTTIINGIAADDNGNQWDLPAAVTISSSGSSTVTATCETDGPVTAAIGTITTIVTPASGWTSVTNAVAATPGIAQESDSALRSRQAISTAQPSQSMLTALEGALAYISGLQYRVYNNKSSSTDANGVPSHSVAVVATTSQVTIQKQIAQNIWVYKGPGCGTYGTTTIPVTDEYGMTTDISFFLTGNVLIDVVATVKMLNGWTSANIPLIQAAIATYINVVGIGNTLYNFLLWSAASSANASLSTPQFSVVSLTAAPHLGMTLDSALSSGTACTSLTTSAAPFPIPSGTNIVLTSGTDTQTITTSTETAAGATTISVTSFTANFAYPVGTTLAWEQSASDIPVNFNYAAQGNVNNITVNPQ